MNQTVREWLDKAEGDLVSARREWRARNNPNFDSACFHAQQAVEKLLKAALISRGTVPPRTHDLVHLSEMLGEVDPAWVGDETELRWLTRAAVHLRYPGDNATREHAKYAVGLAERIAGVVRGLLG